MSKKKKQHNKQLIALSRAQQIRNNVDVQEDSGAFVAVAVAPLRRCCSRWLLETVHLLNKSIAFFFHDLLAVRWRRIVRFLGLSIAPISFLSFRQLFDRGAVFTLIDHYFNMLVRIATQ